MPVFEVSVTLLPLQKVVLPPAVIVADGVVLIVTGVAADVVLQPPEVMITV